MTEILDDEAADLRRANAELQRRLDECCAERDAATAREAALAEVLDVINHSPGDLAPVFDAMLEKALNLCSAAFGVLWTYDDGHIRATAIRGVTPTYGEFLTSGPHRLRPSTAHARLLSGSEVEHIADLADHDDYRSGEATPRALVELAGCRSLLAVALRKDGVFLGDIVIYRREVRPFSDKQIALLQNFAAQAVIAMENARLLGELQQRTDELAARNSEFGERIEHQSATIDVLKAMSASPGDPQPVFDLIVRRARDLCNTTNAALFEFDGELVHSRSRVITPAYRTPEADGSLLAAVSDGADARFPHLPGDS